MDKILKQIKKNRKVSTLQNKKDYYQLGEYQQLRGKIHGISKNMKWVNFEGSTPRQVMKIKAKEFDLIVKKRQLSREEVLLENTSVKAEISHDQED